MSIKLTVTGDSCGKSSGFSPSGTYYAFACWCQPHGTSVSGGIIGFADSLGNDYTYISQVGTQLALDYTGGTLALLSHTANTWYWMYVRNNGTDCVAGIATPTGSFTTIALGGNQPITSPVQCGFGSYFEGEGSTYGKNWSLQNGLFWSGSDANTIPTVAELQAQRTRLLPLPMVGGGSTLLSPYCWWPTLRAAQLGDLSGGGQTLVGAGLDTGDSPPVPWGARPYEIGIRKNEGPAILTLTNRRPVAQFGSVRDENWNWTFPWPQGAGSSVRATVYYVADSASGNVAFEAQIEAITPSDSLDLSGDSFDVVSNSGGITLPATTGHLGRADIVLTSVDSVAEGDYVRLRLTRDTGIAGNASANVQVLGVVVEKL